MKKSKREIWAFEKIKHNNEFIYRLTFSPSLVGFIFIKEIKDEFIYLLKNTEIKQTDNFIIEEVEIDGNKFYLLLSIFNHADLLIHEVYFNELIEFLEEIKDE